MATHRNRRQTLLHGASTEKCPAFPWASAKRDKKTAGLLAHPGGKLWRTALEAKPRSELHSARSCKGVRVKTESRLVLQVGVDVCHVKPHRIGEVKRIRAQSQGLALRNPDCLVY